MLSEDPSQSYSIDSGDDGFLRSIFWADSRSIVDNGYFEHVFFDSTQYSRPFTQFVGVNHRRQLNSFGAPLLYNGSAESF